MIHYPYDYGIMRADAEYRAHLVRQKEDYEADGAFVIHQIGKAIARFGLWLAKIGEEMEVVPRTTTLSEK